MLEDVAIVRSPAEERIAAADEGSVYPARMNIDIAAESAGIAPGGVGIEGAVEYKLIAGLDLDQAYLGFDSNRFHHRLDQGDGIGKELQRARHQLQLDALGAGFTEQSARHIRVVIVFVGIGIVIVHRRRNAGAVAGQALAAQYGVDDGLAVDGVG